MQTGLPFCQLYATLPAIYANTLHQFHPIGNNMAESTDELTINYEEDGVLVVKEVDKEILSTGAWATILFRYQDFDKTTQKYGPDKFTIRRYQKRNGQYQTKSKFNISSTAQAQKIVETLTKWLASNQD